MTDVIYAVPPQDKLEISRATRGEVRFTMTLHGNPDEIDKKCAKMLKVIRTAQASILSMDKLEVAGAVGEAEKTAKKTAKQEMYPIPPKEK